MSEHARLSPSGSKGWLACSGRLALEAAFPNTSNTFSDAGTACHTVASECLTTPSLEPSDWLGELVSVSTPGEPARHVLFDQNLCDMTTGYVDTVRSLAVGHELHVEQRVEFSDFVGVPDQFGTADAIILQPLDDGTDEMAIVDLKTGWGYVPVENNTQLMLYALGALRMFELTHNVKRVRLMIYQPPHGGMREWVIPVGDFA